MARLLCREHGALMVSMSSIPRLAHEMTWGRHSEGHEDTYAYLDFRLAGERNEGFCWLRPFHRRLRRLQQTGGNGLIVVKGLLTPRDVAYCRMMGARMIHVTADEAVRRRRIGLRYPDPPHPALELLERLAAARPQMWDLIIDSDEPFPEFIKSFKALLAKG